MINWLIRFPYSLQEQTPFSWSKSRNRRHSHRLDSLQKSRKSTEFFWERKVSFLSSLKKQPIFHDGTEQWVQKFPHTDDVHYQIWVVLLLIGWNTFLSRHDQSKALPRSGWWQHQYGISADVTQTSFRGETSCIVVKCRLFL